VTKKYDLCDVSNVEKKYCDCCVQRILPVDEYNDLPRDLPIALIFNNLDQLDAGIRKMVPGVLYRFQDICDRNYWDRLTEYEKSLSFSCMEFLIRYEDLPLEMAGNMSDMEVLYVLK